MFSKMGKKFNVDQPFFGNRSNDNLNVCQPPLTPCMKQLAAKEAKEADIPTRASLFGSFQTLNSRSDDTAKPEAGPVPQVASPFRAEGVRRKRGSIFGIVKTSSQFAAGTHKLNTVPFPAQTLPSLPCKKTGLDMQQPVGKAMDLIHSKTKTVRIAAKLSRPLLYPALYTQPQQMDREYRESITAGSMTRDSSSSPFLPADSTSSLDASQKSLACSCVSEPTPVIEKTVGGNIPAPSLAIPKSVEISSAFDKVEKEYFDSYARFSIHQSMIKDEVRTETYRNAIKWNKHLFKGKVVLDVGCGTGILSMFAAKAGARKVIGIEKSNIADFAQKIVSANGFSDVITVIKGKAEEVELPFGLHEVDVIISEWMGYCLFFENMLPTVLFARDKWLKPGGVLFPDRVSLHIAAIEHDEGKERDRYLTYWCNVYGFSMAPMMESAFTTPITTVVPPRKMVSTTATLVKLDLNTCTMADIEFESKFHLEILRDAKVQALVTYFDVEFTACHTNWYFSTSPEYHLTHWKQTVFFLRNHSNMKTSEVYEGVFHLKFNRWHRRHLNIHLELSLKGDELVTNYSDYNTNAISHVNDYVMR